MSLINLPPGVRLSTSLLAQIIEQCGTCNPCGSGSGGGGRSKVPCCSSPSPTAISWVITGTPGDPACTSGTEIPGIDCTIEPDDLNGFNCGPEAPTSAGTASVSLTCGTTTLRISLCCVDVAELPTPRYRLGIYLTILSVGTVQWCTEEFDLGSCSPFIVEVADLVPYYDDFGGARASVVIT